MEKIDYGSLYGVRPGEKDFSGAIQRSLNDGIKHININFIKVYEKFRNNRTMQNSNGVS